MDYAEATRYLISLGNEVRASASDSVHAFKLGLENVAELLRDLGNPQDSYPSVLIAGTNGKGSVAAMLDAVLRSSGSRLARSGSAPGFPTGLYTSPHLVEINERIQVSGIPISPHEFASLFTFLHARIEKLLAEGRLRFHPTFFECLTAMAMEHFRRRRCSLVVFEVGMGGRLDATNTASPRVAVLTEIDFDHERFLGHTIAAIAGEKAGIVKPGGVLVSAASHPEAVPVIRERARQEGARLIEVFDEYRTEDLSAQDGRYSFLLRHRDGFALRVSLALRGRHQVRNALAAVAAARELARLEFPVEDSDIQQGLASATWPGRLELVRESPRVFLDGAHNPSGARALVRFWEEQYPSRRIILVYGAMRDKAVPEIAEILFPRASAVILTRPERFRSASPEAVREFTGHLNANLLCVEEPGAALDSAVALAKPEDVIFVTGSLYLVGNILAEIRRRASERAISGSPSGEPLPASAWRR
jgi:dihydrofolate synthase / folylpolyglutamate synthase